MIQQNCDSLILAISWINLPNKQYKIYEMKYNRKL